MSLVVGRSLSKIYATDNVEVRAVQGVSFEIKAGAFLCFVGPSASGKTTLVNWAGDAVISTRWSNDSTIWSRESTFSV